MKKFTLTILALGFWLFALNAQIANTDTTDAGVLINGVVWATRNVDAPGTFAQNPEDMGMLYQYNIKVGWSSADPMIATNGSTIWNTTPSLSTFWEYENDPCPCGWRIPNITEVNALVSSVSYYIWSFNYNNNASCPGRVFIGENDLTIFIPEYSARKYNGELYLITNPPSTTSPYWTNQICRQNAENDEELGVNLFVLSVWEWQTYTWWFANSCLPFPVHLYGLPIRCVKNEEEECESECLYTLNVFSNDNILGDVQGINDNQIIVSTSNNNSTVFCGTIELIAIEKESAVFTSWNDGNTDNPRIINVISDTTFIANFTSIDTSIENISAKNIKILPNPTTSELQIINNEQLIISNVEICNVTGKSLFNIYYSNNSIDVSLLPQGIYLIKIYTDKGLKIERFIKR